LIRTLQEIAELLGGELIGDGKIPITGIQSLDEAKEGHLSFYMDPRYKRSIHRTRASALIVGRETPYFQGPQVVVSNPGLAYAAVAKLYAPPLTGNPGVSPDAVIHKKVQIGSNVSVFPQVYISKGAIIEHHVTLYPGVFIGERVRIGEGSIIHPNVSILHDCLIGNRVIIHAGTVIGCDGFGFVPDGEGRHKIPQIGIVQIDDDVEIGANCTVDRAALGKTWLKRGVKTDNLVQIAHNVVIGENTVLVAQAGISGSTKIGRQVIIGGQVGIGDHLEVGDKAMIGSQSGVAKSIPPGDVVSGSPTMPHRLWLRITRLIMRLPKLRERMILLEKRLEAIEGQLANKQNL
jgi:UDP-3-O-[3-hydroxymyristoyl] glucosamine N-acyltransferase